MRSSMRTKPHLNPWREMGFTDAKMLGQDLENAKECAKECVHYVARLSGTSEEDVMLHSTMMGTRRGEPTASPHKAVQVSEATSARPVPAIALAQNVVRLEQQRKPCEPMSLPGSARSSSASCRPRSANSEAGLSRVVRSSSCVSPREPYSMCATPRSHAVTPGVPLRSTVYSPFPSVPAVACPKPRQYLPPPRMDVILHTRIAPAAVRVVTRTQPVMVSAPRIPSPLRILQRVVSPPPEIASSSLGSHVGVNCSCRSLASCRIRSTDSIAFGSPNGSWTGTRSPDRVQHWRDPVPASSSWQTSAAADRHRLPHGPLCSAPFAWNPQASEDSPPELPTLLAPAYPARQHLNKADALAGLTTRSFTPEFPSPRAKLEIPQVKEVLRPISPSPRCWSKSTEGSVLQTRAGQEKA